MEMTLSRYGFMKGFQWRVFGKKVRRKIIAALIYLKTAFLGAFFNKKGEAYVDTGLKILIAVVIGALLLGGLYALFGDTILPKLTQKITELFSYNG